MRELGVPVTIARELDEADAVVTLRNYYRRKPSALRDAESNGIPIYVLKTNTILQMENMLASLFDLEADPSGGGPARDGRGDRAGAGLRPTRWSWLRRTPTSGGSSTRWPSATALMSRSRGRSRTGGSS